MIFLIVFLNGVKPLLCGFWQETSHHEGWHWNFEIRLRDYREFDFVVWGVTLHNSEIVNCFAPDCVLWDSIKFLTICHGRWISVILPIVIKVKAFVIEVSWLDSELLLLLSVGEAIGPFTPFDQADKLTGVHVLIPLDLLISEVNLQNFSQKKLLTHLISFCIWNLRLNYISVLK